MDLSDHSSQAWWDVGSVSRAGAQYVHTQQSRQLHLASLHERFCGLFDHQDRDVKAEGVCCADPRNIRPCCCLLSDTGCSSVVVSVVVGWRGCVAPGTAA